MKVKEMMHKGVECVAPDATVSDVAKIMKRHDIGAVPVAENGKCLGMVTDRDLAIRCFADGKDVSKLKAKDVMTENFVYCRDNEEAEDAIRIMESKQIRRLPVMDKDQRMIGMISLGDISHCLPQNIAGEVTKAVSAHHA